jgi:hypothetical protein
MTFEADLVSVVASQAILYVTGDWILCCRGNRSIITNPAFNIYYIWTQSKLFSQTFHCFHITACWRIGWGTTTEPVGPGTSWIGSFTWGWSICSVWSWSFGWS